MNEIEKLIQELCPDGVEYRRLGECVEILDSQRKPISKEKRIPGIYPYYGANGIQDYVENYLFDGVFLLVGEDGSVINKDNTPVLNWAEGKIWVNNHAHILKQKNESILLRFIYFTLQQVDVSNVVRGVPPKLNQANLNQITIPLPPITIQEKIVEILDKFTSLEAELEAELEARRKQYEYYREKLLTFSPEEVEYRRLGEVADCYSGATPKTSIAAYWENGTIPWMNSGEVNLGRVYKTENKITKAGYDSCSTKMVPPHTVVVALAGQGKTRGTVAITEIELCTNQSLCAIKVQNEIVNSYYLYHYLRGQYLTLRKISSGDGTRGGLNQNMIRNFEIPLPPLSEQRRIVEILDRFEALTNDLQAGLPAELMARRQQYEYYREKLLTFKRKTV